MTAPYSKAEDQFRKLMGVFGLFFLIGAILFAVVPDVVVIIVNWFGGLFNDQSIAPVMSKISVGQYMDIFYDDTGAFEAGQRLPGHGMYLSLAVAFMVMLTVICGLIFYDPRKYGVFAILVIVGKFASSLTGLGLYLWSYAYFANLVVMITDFPIAVLVLIFYLRARAAQPAPAPNV